MVRRPDDWEKRTDDQKMRWLRTQRHEYKGGRRAKLTDKDAEKVWGLLRTYNNKSLVADMLGVGRKTLYRFLKDHPVPETFQLEKNVEDYSEIKTWLNRQKAFAKQSVIDGYMLNIQAMHDWMKENHPERQRPKLWTSDDINEFVYGEFEPYQQHNVIVPLRQLALKAPREFPMIDLGLLPTKRTHKAKRSLAGKPQYYLSGEQVRAMIKNVPKPIPVIEARNKAMISLLFNIACRTGNAKQERGLIGIRIENLNLKAHSLVMKDKGNITWNVSGLSDQTIQYIREYLKVRGNPKVGYLFVDENGSPMTQTDVNKMLKKAGHKAGIQSYNKKTGKGKKLVAKTFRKSFVKYALDDCGINPVSLIGTGKNVKTCFCVGWSDMKVLMEHYAPHLEKQIEEDRQKFTF